MTGAFRSELWAEPDWLSDGDYVWVRISDLDLKTGKTRVARCRVAVAAGDYARVTNSARGIDRWVSLASLLVPPDDPHHPNARDETARAILEATGGQP